MPDEKGRWSDEEVYAETDRLDFAGIEPAEFIVRRTAQALIDRRDVNTGILTHVPVCPGGQITLPNRHIPHRSGGSEHIVLEAQIRTQLIALGWKF